MSDFTGGVRIAYTDELSPAIQKTNAELAAMRSRIESLNGAGAQSLSKNMLQTAAATTQMSRSMSLALDTAVRIGRTMRTVGLTLIGLNTGAIINYFESWIKESQDANDALLRFRNTQIALGLVAGAGDGELEAASGRLRGGSKGVGANQAIIIADEAAKYGLIGDRLNEVLEIGKLLSEFFRRDLLESVRAVAQQFAGFDEDAIGKLIGFELDPQRRAALLESIKQVRLWRSELEALSKAQGLDDYGAVRVGLPVAPGGRGQVESIRTLTEQRGVDLLSGALKGAAPAGRQTRDRLLAVEALTQRFTDAARASGEYRSESQLLGRIEDESTSRTAKLNLEMDRARKTIEGLTADKFDGIDVEQRVIALQDAYKKALAGSNAEAERQRRVIKETYDPGSGFLAGIRDIKEEYEKLGDAVRGLTTGFANNLTSGIADTAFEIAAGFEKANVAVKKLAASIIGDLARSMFQLLAQQAVRGLLGLFIREPTPSANAGSGGGSFPFWGQGGARAAGGANLSGGDYGEGMHPMTFARAYGRLPMRTMAGGGTGLLRSPALIAAGEAGEEAFVRTRNGKIPVETSGGSSNSMSVTVNIGGRVGPQDMDEMRRTADQVVAAWQDAYRRNHKGLRTMVRSG